MKRVKRVEGWKGGNRGEKESKGGGEGGVVYDSCSFEEEAVIKLWGLVCNNTIELSRAK